MANRSTLPHSQFPKTPNYWNETPWHRDWKNAFPLTFREQSFYNHLDGQLHRADVHTPCGTTIEFQNSPITLRELESRESFYPKLIWVLNGAKFKGFKILKALPDLNDPRMADFEFSASANLTMVRKIDILAKVNKPKVYSLRHPVLNKISITADLYSFCWRHPHQVWYEAKCPIIFDFGGYFLYQLLQREQLLSTYSYLKLIPRTSFISQFIK